MYAKGNQIPGVAQAPRRAAPPPPPPPGGLMQPPYPAIVSPAPGQQVAVTAEQLDVRSGPGLNHPLVTHVAKGAVLVIRGSAPGWLYVQLPNGTFGWVMSKFTAPVSSPPASG
jgi:uncharacterized protein YgiM (DUF1202 family)